MNFRLLALYFAVIVLAQCVAWYQSNSLLLWDWLKDNYIPIVVCTSPFVGLAFAYGTKVGYDVLGSLWAVRFSAFAVGYLVFIFLAWYHLGENPFSLKNIITSFLCFSLLSVQIMWKE